MHILADPNDDDFEFLPPAVRRKFFSNLERFRLERRRLARSHHCYYGQRYRSNRPSPSTPLHSRPARAQTVAISSPFSSKKHHSLQKQTTRRLRKPSQDASLITPEDWQYFHSLPPKIQQTHFSKEEQLLLLQTCPAGDITDAADQALYKFEQRRRALLEPETRYPSEVEGATIDSSFSMVSSSRSSVQPVDSAIDMDDSLYDSFRWLDEEGDLDLTLDAYHSHIVDSAVSRSQTVVSQRRKPSFRRTLSFTAMHRGRASTSNASHRALNSSQSTNIPFPVLSQTAHSWNSQGRPASSQPLGPRHVSHHSSSSIDPSAQYYQDPEARLKLRVYLASPQKFDEAIEFGFPSLDNKENIRSRQQGCEPKKSSQTNPQDAGRTFLEDDAASVGGNAIYDRKSDLKAAKIRKDSGLGRQPQPLQPVSSRNPPGGRHREMTLKMTLTRPDLRTADSSHSEADDPLKLAELPPADENANIWDDLPERRGVVKKMWRKFVKRRD